MTEDKINNANKSLLKDYFDSMCSTGDLDGIRYLLTSPNVKNKLEIGFDGVDGLRRACKSGYLDVVRYLTSSDELETHVYYREQDDICFNWACYENRIEILKYFIFELEIEYSDGIYKFLLENPNEQVDDMFYTRQLQEKLNREMPINEETKINRKNKI